MGIGDQKRLAKVIDNTFPLKKGMITLATAGKTKTVAVTGITADWVVMFTHTTVTSGALHIGGRATAGGIIINIATATGSTGLSVNYVAFGPSYTPYVE